MNRFFPAAALAVAAALNVGPPKAGQLAPSFALPDQSGKTISLAASRGAKTVLVFYRGYW